MRGGGCWILRFTPSVLLVTVYKPAKMNQIDEDTLGPSPYKRETVDNNCVSDERVLYIINGELCMKKAVWRILPHLLTKTDTNANFSASFESYLKIKLLL